MRYSIDCAAGRSKEQRFWCRSRVLGQNVGRAKFHLGLALDLGRADLSPDLSAKASATAEAFSEALAATLRVAMRAGVSLPDAGPSQAPTIA
jgi:hypothetical protein